MNVAIIGCGLIGKKRAKALRSSQRDDLKIACDINKERAEALGAEFRCQHEIDWKKVVCCSDIQVVINASINSILEPITVAALSSGKHVLCEKPLGRNSSEAQSIISAAEKNHVVLKTGFNHRFHPALWKAKHLTDANGIGKIISIRARYGHGGRPGMEKEWRTSWELSGGGELIDQGVHIIDLIRWFGGDIIEVFGVAQSKFWKTNVEDNAFAILKTNQGVTASFHVSWTNWRNVFSFEIFGTDGYMEISGLGGSYGAEVLELGKRKKEGGRPDIQVFEFPLEDMSWEKEWEEFRAAINENRQPIGNGADGLEAIRVVEALYESSKSNKVIQLK